jgi:hypothetical protein
VVEVLVVQLDRVEEVEPCLASDVGHFTRKNKIHKSTGTIRAVSKLQSLASKKKSNLKD